MYGSTYFFEIQRSQNAKDWAKIGEVSASGESSSVRDYSFQDEKPFSGNNYYRPKMIDKDQTYAFGGIRNAWFAGSPGKSFYPNPVMGQLTIKTKYGEPIKNIQIVNTGGQKVYYSELNSDDSGWQISKWALCPEGNQGRRASDNAQNCDQSLGNRKRVLRIEHPFSVYFRTFSRKDSRFF